MFMRQIHKSFEEHVILRIYLSDCSDELDLK